jgi:hypothetical protein
MTILRLRIACWIQTHTQNAFCLSVATMVARTHLNVTFVHCLSFYICYYSNNQSPTCCSFCWVIIWAIYIYIYIYIYVKKYKIWQKHTWISQFTNSRGYINAICYIPLSFIISDMCTVVILMTTRQAMEVNVTLRRFRTTIIAVVKQ